MSMELWNSLQFTVATLAEGAADGSLVDGMLDATSEGMPGVSDGVDVVGAATKAGAGVVSSHGIKVVVRTPRPWWKPIILLAP